MNNTLENYINNSFLKDYLNGDYSDIAYNGKIFSFHSVKYGRILKKINDVSENDVFNFIKHIANICGKNFNTSNPIMDVSFANYRLNAIHPSLAKNINGGNINFTLRIASKIIRITDENFDFATKEVYSLLKSLINNKISIIISGVTGVGKTEFQRYLISKMSDNMRLIMIEDTYESMVKELFPNFDISTWVCDDQYLLKKCIKSGLRSNPDYLMISEVRGSEVKEMFDTLTSGIPIITTIHSDSAKNVLNRIVQLFGMETKFNVNEIKKEIVQHVNVFIHLKKYINNKVIFRKIEEILICYSDGDVLCYHYIYENKDEIRYFDLPSTIAKKLGIKQRWYK